MAAAVEWNGGDQEGWDMVNAFNTVFIDTIRQSGGSNPYRILMIPGYGANCWEGVKHLEVPKDDKIAVSVHAYEPYDFALNTKGRARWNTDTSNIDAIMKSMDELFLSQGIPVVIGEFGAMHKDAEGNEAGRGAWVEYYVRTAKEKGIPCVWWWTEPVKISGTYLRLREGYWTAIMPRGHAPTWSIIKRIMP